MAHYTGPKGRVNRRLGAMIYETHGAIKAAERRSTPPGMHTRRGKSSTYGIALNEKQKIKHYYGVSERQLRRYFDIASRAAGNTGESLLLLCERRLDNVIRRAGLTFTRSQARQGVAHGHFTVNGVKTDVPSFLVRPGDIITVRPRSNIQNVYRQRIEEGGRGETVPWLGVDTAELKITVLGYPSRDDISLPVEKNMVVEFMSR